jgi:hypothetical protein
LKVRTGLATLAALACTWYVPGRADDGKAGAPLAAAPWAAAALAAGPLAGALL